MDSTDQVVFVLQVILAVGPLAVYFLGLGLVNSQSRPVLVDARSDFLVLAVAFVPLIVCPLIGLLARGFLIMAAVSMIAVAGAFFWLLPSRGSGWVIYNIDTRRCRTLLGRACRRSGVSFDMAERGCQLADVGVTLRFSTIPWLRNVSIQIDTVDAQSNHRRLTTRIFAAMQKELDGESLLPSPTGASLVMIGATLLGVPMWYFFHHMEAIVDVVRRILVA